MNKILVRNLIIATIPYYLLLIVVFFTAYTLSGMDSYKVYNAASYEDACNQYQDNHLNFELEIKSVKYSGFDYVLNNKKLGGYYYRFDGKNIKLFVLSDSSYEKIKKQGKSVVLCSAVYDESAANYFVKEYSSSLGVSADELDEMISPLIFSEPAYPLLKVRVLEITKKVVIGTVIIISLYIILAIFVPSLNVMTKRLVRQTGRRNILRKITREIKLHLLYHDKNVYVTEKYMIVTFVNKIDVIVLDDIKYLSKHSEVKKKSHGTDEVVYRLSASNADDFYYEYIFEDEESIDEVVRYIRGVEADEEVEEKHAAYELPKDIEDIVNDVVSETEKKA